MYGFAAREPTSCGDPESLAKPLTTETATRAADVRVTNAFFIVEVVRTLAEEAGGLGEVGKRTLPRQVFAGGVQAVVQRRLSRVPEWARPLLKLAAVAGRRIDRKVLGAIEPELDRWLQSSSNAAILEVSDAEWRFAHDKLREGLLVSLKEDERRALHKQVGETLVKVYGETGPHVGALGYHFEEANELAKAAHYLSQAGGLSLRRGAVREATELLTRALRLQEKIGAPPLERTTTLRRLARAWYGLGQVEECLQVTKQAMALLGRPLPKTRLSRVGALLRETAIELHNRIRGPRPVRDPVEQSIAKEYLSLMRSNGETLFVSKIGFDEVLYIMLSALHAAEGIADPAEEVNYLCYFGFVTYAVPLHKLGRFYVEAGRKKMQTAPPRLSLGTFYAMASYIYYADANWPAVIDAQARWLDAAQKGGDEAQQGLIHTTRAAVWLTMGRYDDVLAAGRECLRIGTLFENKSLRAYGLAWQAVVMERCGDLARASELFREAHDLVMQATRSIDKASINSLRARTLANCGELAAAREQTDAALARMARSRAPTPQFSEGYFAIVDAALILFQASRTTAERELAGRRLQQALWQLVRFAYKFPIAWPRAQIGLGRYLWLRGQHALGLRAIAASLQGALRMELPYETALAHLWLGRFLASDGAARSPNGESARAHLQQAAERFTKLGIPIERSEAERALRLFDE